MGDPCATYTCRQHRSGGSHQQLAARPYQQTDSPCAYRMRSSTDKTNVMVCGNSKAKIWTEYIWRCTWEPPFPKTAAVWHKDRFSNNSNGQARWDLVQQRASDLLCSCNCFLNQVPEATKNLVHGSKIVMVVSLLGHQEPLLAIGKQHKLV